MLILQPVPQDWRDLSCNTHGPMILSRSERLNATVLGRDDGHISCPRIRRVGLEFHGRDPLEVAEKLLADAGIDNPDELRRLVDIPAGPLICRPDPSPRRLSVDHPRYRRGILRHVLILALSTPYLYDPARPVLLTRASLSRCLELFDTEGYYA